MEIFFFMWHTSWREEARGKSAEARRGAHGEVLRNVREEGEKGMLGSHGGMPGKREGSEREREREGEGEERKRERVLWGRGGNLLYGMGGKKTCPETFETEA